MVSTKSNESFTWSSVTKSYLSHEVSACYEVAPLVTNCPGMSQMQFSSLIPMVQKEGMHFCPIIQVWHQNQHQQVQ